MQVLTTQCPYCQAEVETTSEHVDGSVLCPHCNKPFEMEMPVATVTSVREVDTQSIGDHKLADEPEEQELLVVHPAVLRAQPLWTLLAFVAFAVGVMGLVMSLFATTTLSETTFDGAGSMVLWGSLLLILLGGGYVAVAFLRSRFTTLTVTDERTIYREGFVSRETSEVQHDDVRNIQLDQSFFQRLLGVGGIGISSSGQDDLEVVANGVPNPERVIDLVRENQR